MLLDLAMTNVSLTAGRSEPGADRLGIQAERVIGRDMPVDGLVLPASVLQLVEQEQAVGTLSELRDLAPNWDGYGALPVSDEAMGNSKEALLRLLRYAPTPDITPNPNGTISFEWTSGQGEAHLEIGKTRFSFFVKPRRGKSILTDGPVSAINDELASLVTAIVFPSAGSLTAITRATYTAGYERTVG
jgi:hypothetical protein